MTDFERALLAFAGLQSIYYTELPDLYVDKDGFFRRAWVENNGLTIVVESPLTKYEVMYVESSGKYEFSMISYENN